MRTSCKETCTRNDSPDIPAYVRGFRAGSGKSTIDPNEESACYGCGMIMANTRQERRNGKDPLDLRPIAAQDRGMVFVPLSRVASAIDREEQPPHSAWLPPLDQGSEFDTFQIQQIERLAQQVVYPG